MTSDVILFSHMASDVPLANLKVSHNIHHDRKEWNVPFLQSIFEP